VHINNTRYISTHDGRKKHLENLIEMADNFVQTHQRAYGELRSKVKSYSKERDMEKVIDLRTQQLRECEM
jgi:hypothetical protein